MEVCCRLRGEAEAFAIEAKAKADAEQLQKKADAFREYKQAALVELVLDALPKVAAEVAQPLTNTEKITMVATGDGQIGAARLADEVMHVMQRLPNLVNEMTGIDINKVTHSAHPTNHTPLTPSEYLREIADCGHAESAVESPAFVAAHSCRDH